MGIFSTVIKNQQSEKNKSDNPIDIFNSMSSSSLKEELGIESLRDYQQTILSEWYSKVSTNLNSGHYSIDIETGAGKTLIGLLMAESLRIKNNKKIVYLCVTRELVNEVYDKARKMGSIKVSSYLGGSSGWQNQEDYLANLSILITTYDALLNYKSIFKSHDIDGIVFDDFHRYSDINARSNIFEIAGEEYREFLTMLIQGVKNTDTKERIKGILSGENGISFDINLSELIDLDNEVRTFIKNNTPNINNLQKDFFLKNNKQIYFIGLSPSKGIINCQFFPAVHEVFDNIRYGVYLSATIFSKDYYYKYTGIENIELLNPGKTSSLISERLFLAFVPFNISDFISNHKSVIVCTSKSELDIISNDPNVIISSGDTLPKDIREFKESSFKSLALINRYDGIDIKGQTKIELILTNFGSTWNLQENINSSFYGEEFSIKEKITYNLIQALGRIVRGRGERGLFVINNKRLLSWLFNKDNLALFPASIQQQLEVGLQYSKNKNYDFNLINNELINHFLLGDSIWKETYEEMMEATRGKTEISDSTLSETVKFEAQLLNHISEGNYNKAIDFYEKNKLSIEFGLSEKKLSWMLLILGFISIKDGNIKMGRIFFSRAHTINKQILLNPAYKRTGSKISQIDSVIELRNNENISFLLDKLNYRHATMDANDSDDFEKKIESLGSLLGFSSNRPDKQLGKGPDVLWIDEENKIMYGFELKTNKISTSTYDKKEIGQIEQHENALVELFPSKRDFKKYIIVLGPELTIDNNASPNDSIKFWNIDDFFKFLKTIQNNIFSIQTESDLNKYKLSFLEVQKLIEGLKKFKNLKFNIK